MQPDVRKNLPESVLANLPIGVIVLDTEYRVIVWSRGQEAESGIIEEDVLGISLLDLLPNLCDERVAQKKTEDILSDIIRTGNTTLIEGFEHTTPDGELAIFDLRCGPLRDETGKITGIVITNDNVTEREDNLELMRRKTTRFELERDRMARVFRLINHEIPAQETTTRMFDVVTSSLKSFGWSKVYLVIFEDENFAQQTSIVGFEEVEIDIVDKLFADKLAFSKFLNKMKSNDDDEKTCFIITPEELSSQNETTEEIIKTVNQSMGEDTETFIMSLRKSDGSMLGCVLGFGEDGAGKYFGEELSVLQLLARSISSAVKDSRNEIINDRYNTGFAAIANIGQLISSILILDKLFETVVALLHSHSRYQLVSLYTVDINHNVLKLEVYQGAEDISVKHSDFVVPIGEGCVGRVAQNAELEYIQYTPREAKHVLPDFASGIHSEVAIPITIENDVYAVLDVGSLHNDAFDEVDILTLKTLCSQISVAIRNALLLEEISGKAVELASVNDELKRMDSLKEEFVSVLVHDLRTPLTGIVGSVDLVEEVLSGSIDERTMQLIKIIGIESQKIGRIISDVREFYNLKSDKLQLKKEDFELLDLLTMAKLETEARFIKQESQIEVQDVKTPTNAIFGDYGKILIALTNLISTVIEQPGGNPVRISGGFSSATMLTVRIQTAITTGTALLFEQTIQKIEQSESFYDEMPHGSDLKIAVAKMVVEAHTGQIGVDIDENYLDIWFTIPFEEVNP